MNNHDVLGVSPSASTDEIKRAFREAAKELHPDHSSSPEAAAAFARIKEAHDALIKEAESAPKESSLAHSATARSVATASAAAFQKTDDTAVDDATTKLVQELDDAVLKANKKSFFRRSKVSPEVKKHQKKLKTNERRLKGQY